MANCTCGGPAAVESLTARVAALEQRPIAPQLEGANAEAAAWRAETIAWLEAAGVRDGDLLQRSSDSHLTDARIRVGRVQRILDSMLEYADEYRVPDLTLFLEDFLARRKQTGIVTPEPAGTLTELFVHWRRDLLHDLADSITRTFGVGRALGALRGSAALDLCCPTRELRARCPIKPYPRG